jgi:ABC-type sugar transport system ATPase subunit
MARVVLRNLSKVFSGPKVVDDVNLTIDDGELMVFVGPSGCGKSTTLRMIAGLETASSGEVHIGDREVTTLEPKDRNVAMVFQNYALYAHKTVKENLAFGLKVRKVDKAEISESVKVAADMLGIADLLNRKPKQLSGGQMQRVALGRALVRNPEVFLLDEPLSNLDAKMRVRMREEISKLHKEMGVSMVYVTHDQIEAMTLGDRIAVMHEGRIQQVGPPLEIYDRPANTFVANFIGSPEMNMIEGELIKKDGAVLFCAGEFSLPFENAPIQEAIGKTEVTLGIRPEHIQVAEQSEIGMRGTLDFVEQMGSQTLCQVIVDGVKLKSLVDRNDALTDSMQVGVSPDMTKLHLFSSGTGHNLVFSRESQSRR